MKLTVNSLDMKRIDDYTVEVCHIPALELMEEAAKKVVAVMKNRITKEDRILVVCGPGNNGGDGVAAGRILFLQGYHVAILFIGSMEKTSPSMRIQMEKAKNMGIPLENYDKLHEYNIIIDSLFGVGLSREVSGEFEAIIHRINQNSNFVYSVDMPSGISADNGRVMGVAVKADETITFGYQKLGLLLYPGAEYAGHITVADIGFSKDAEELLTKKIFYYEQEDLKGLPKRRAYSNKGTYGKVLIIAGSKGMSGAAYLSAKAAYRTGAGLVQLLTAEANRVIIQASLPEAIFTAYDEEGLTTEEKLTKIRRAMDGASVIVLGPGLGLSEMAARLVETVINEAIVPVIIDADAITLLAKQLDELFGYSDSTKSERTGPESKNEVIQKRLKYLESILRNPTILTPHLKELSRLIGVPVTEIANNLIDTANQCSYNNKLIYTIKDARTVVTKENETYINVSGNNGMATGGSGDVLTGIIAALIAQGMEAFQAACLGVYIHGLAGDIAAKEKGVYSLMASDIVNSIEKVLGGKG